MITFYGSHGLQEVKLNFLAWLIMFIASQRFFLWHYYLPLSGYIFLNCSTFSGWLYECESSVQYMLRCYSLYFHLFYGAPTYLIFIRWGTPTNFSLGIVSKTSFGQETQNSNGFYPAFCSFSAFHIFELIEFPQLKMHCYC